MRCNISMSNHDILLAHNVLDILTTLCVAISTKSEYNMYLVETMMSR